MTPADDQPTLADEIAAVANIKRQHGWDSAEIVESSRRMAEEWETGKEVETGNEGGRGMNFTPGPWQWEVTPGGDVRLATPDRGKLYVMGFARKGMRGAQPRFALWGEGPRERRGGIMHDFVEAGAGEHPDARLIALAPEMLSMLIELEDALEDGRWQHTKAAIRKLIAKATGETE